MSTRQPQPPGREIVAATDRLTKKYSGRLAVNEVTMNVRRGEVYGFLGPNGAGKTTTLRMLLGLIRPTSGQVRLTAGRVGGLVEGPGFYPYLSGRENLRVMACHAGLDTRAVDRALSLVGLTDRAKDRFRSYSLGMKQRLGVGAALLGDPDLVVLDEPTNGLDPSGMADMRDLVTTLASAGRTVLLSSHLLTEVQAVCDRVGVISEGRLLAEDAVGALCGEQSVRVRAEPTDRALAIAMGVVGDDGVRVFTDSTTGARELRCQGGEDLVPKLTSAFVSANIQINEITVVERSLEEVFFEMTRNQADQADAARSDNRRAVAA